MWSIAVCGVVLKDPQVVLQLQRKYIVMKCMHPPRVKARHLCFTVVKGCSVALGYSKLDAYFGLITF